MSHGDSNRFVKVLMSGLAEHHREALRKKASSVLLEQPEGDQMKILIHAFALQIAAVHKLTPDPHTIAQAIASGKAHIT